ncbi:TPA: hypothetical protein MIQ52_000387 [Klebsiella aerogenes]|nr:hypothetical protein [Klebsiella aerogenes]HBY1540621.1 hypothetical protein [Klebsiella aerogenes]HBY1603481.1 hypothetical protein [Klebsiella aerogenes]HBY1639885.1 hypothetical protein [Klebsiella aerogenes]
MSTGARTKAGRKRQQAGYRAWLEKQRASKTGRKRTRTYTSEVISIGSDTLQEISTSTPESRLQQVSGIMLWFTGESLSVRPPSGESISVALATTSPRYGGVRWWYVCPECGKRKTSLYLSGTALRCRQCAGLHYASQNKPTR